MPRNRRDDPENTNLKSQDIEEDYLDVDKPLSGQNYYCISFVSPEDQHHFKVIQKKMKKWVTMVEGDGLV